MVAGIYARKSNEQHVTDDAKSVTRQIENAKAFAAERGWTVDADSIFVDDGVSGASFRRPGLMRMLNALKPRAPFDVLIISELSRLGREQFKTGAVLAELLDADVRLFAYLDAKEVACDNPTDKFLVSAVNFAAEIEREKGAQRVTDAMTRRARNGHVCGGEPFGYRNRAVVGPDDRRSHVERVVHEDEAAVVRRIFALCAEGHGVKAIAKRLNAEGVTAPRPKGGRVRGWAPSSVRVILHREAYKGVTIWNRTSHDYKKGREIVTRRPESEWIRVDAPALRIVSDAEWDAAHRRLKASAESYARSTGGKLWGRPPAGLASKYLLSGLGRCAKCGASMTVRSSSGARQFYYVCASYDHRGAAVCANGLRLPMRAADDAILTQVADVILNREIVEGAIADAVSELRPSRERAEERRKTLDAELRKVDEQQTNYVAAIAVAGNVDALARALKDCDVKRSRLQRELAALDGLAKMETFDVKRVERDLRTRLKEWRGLLCRQVPISRQVLDRLLDGRITWTPAEDRYEFAARATYDKLLNGIVPTFTRGGIPVRGFEPRSRG